MISDTADRDAHDVGMSVRAKWKPSHLLDLPALIQYRRWKLRPMEFHCTRSTRERRARPGPGLQIDRDCAYRPKIFGKDVGLRGVIGGRLLSINDQSGSPHSANDAKMTEIWEWSIDQVSYHLGELQFVPHHSSRIHSTLDIDSIKGDTTCCRLQNPSIQLFPVHIRLAAPPGSKMGVVFRKIWGAYPNLESLFAYQFVASYLERYWSRTHLIVVALQPAFTLGGLIVITPRFVDLIVFH